MKPNAVAVTRFEVESEAYQAYVFLKKAVLDMRLGVVQAAVVQRTDGHARVVDRFDYDSDVWNDARFFGAYGNAHRLWSEDKAVDHTMIIRQTFSGMEQDGTYVVCVMYELAPQIYNAIVGKWESETARYSVSKQFGRAPALGGRIREGRQESFMSPYRKSARSLNLPLLR